MSVMDDLKRLLRGVIRKAKSNFLYRENHRYGEDEVDISGRDKVAVSMANQKFALVYPPSQPICSMDTTFNSTSWSNFFLAFLASVLTCTSGIIFSLLIFSMMMVGILSVMGSVVAGLPAIMVSNSILALTASAGTLLAGFGVRKLDRWLTMVNCIKLAEEKLRDPKIRHEETALLEWKESKSKIRHEIDKLTANIKASEAEIKRVEEMCDKVLEMEHLSPFQIEADLKPHLDTIDKLAGMIIEWKKLRSKFEERIKTIEQRNQQMRVMGAALIGSGNILPNVNNGKLAEEVQDINNSIVELMEDIEKKNEYLHQDLLIESGLADDTKKPPQIE